MGVFLGCSFWLSLSGLDLIACSVLRFRFVICLDFGGERWSGVVGGIVLSSKAVEVAGDEVEGRGCLFY